jgi:hypothetical protein
MIAILRALGYDMPERNASELLFLCYLFAQNALFAVKWFFERKRGIDR